MGIKNKKQAAAKRSESKRARVGVHNCCFTSPALRLKLKISAEKTVHSTNPFLGSAVRTRTLLAVIDVDPDFSPCFGDFGFAVAGQSLRLGSCVLLAAREDPGEEVLLGRSDCGSSKRLRGVVCRRIALSLDRGL